MTEVAGTLSGYVGNYKICILIPIYFLKHKGFVIIFLQSLETQLMSTSTINAKY